ncbi:alpha/beta fold hydrolase [soil metagenome]
MLTLLLAGAMALAQTPAATSTPVSVEVALPSQPAPLHGTLLTPQGRTRAVAVILPGSGPTDRNGDNPLGASGGNLRMLAEGLADQGVATIRIDKRAIGESAAAGPDESKLKFTDYADDARAWAAEAASRTGAPCAWLIGHSEGSLVALAATRTPDDRICGLVLTAAPGRALGDILREQLAALPEPLKTPALVAIAELEQGRTVTDTPPQLAALFRPSVQPFVISMLAQDPAALIAAYDGPVLIVQGTTDLQVTMADARALSAAQPRATLAPFEGVNHMLKIAPMDRAANLATYRDPSLPLAPGVVDTVAGFILSHTPAQ